MERIRQYIDSDYDIDIVTEDSETPLIVAIKSGNSEVAQMLLPYCNNIDHQDNGQNTALFLAVKLNMLKLAERILDAGAIPDVVCKYDTPLTLAAGSLYAPAVELLISKGATVDCVDCLGNTPLMRAAAEWEAKQYSEAAANSIVSLLIEKGADVNWVGDEDCTPLLYAIMAKRPNTVKLLLEAGADANASRGITKRAPLIIAIEKNQPEIVRLLLEHGADPCVKDTDGSSPLDIAKRWGCVVIIKLLEATK